MGYLSGMEGKTFANLGVGEGTTFAIFRDPPLPCKLMDPKKGVMLKRKVDASRRHVLGA